MGNLGGIAQSSLVTKMGQARSNLQMAGASSLQPGTVARSAYSSEEATYRAIEAAAMEAAAHDAMVKGVSEPGGAFINHMGSLYMMRLKIEQRNRCGSLTRIG